MQGGFFRKYWFLGTRKILKWLIKDPKKYNEMVLSYADYEIRDEMMFNRAELFENYVNSVGKDKLKEKINLLGKDLDQNSIETIKKFWDLQHYVYTHNLIKKEIWYEPDQKIPGQDHFPVPPYISGYLEDVFYYHSGLRLIPEENKKQIDQTDFVDCGAFYGDSALAYETYYNPKNVYSFEPVTTNYNNLVNTINFCNLKRTHAVKKGVGNEKLTTYITSDGLSSNLDLIGNSKEKEQIEVETIDNFVFENGLTPGVIKLDVEGFEYNTIIGAMKTIKQFKPVLTIAVYHTPKDFLEIKPLIEEKVGNYTFIIRHLVTYHPIYEYVLIGYPKLV